MRKLLEKLKLIQHFQSVLNLTTSEFKKILSGKIDNEKPGFISDSFDLINTSKNNYKGNIAEGKFQFKYRRKLFSGLLSYPLIEGSFFEENKKLRVHTTINAFKGPMIAIAIVGILGLLINVALGIVAWQNNTPEDDMIFVGVISAMLIMNGVAFTLMLLSISMLQKKISQDLFDIHTK